MQIQVRSTWHACGAKELTRNVDPIDPTFYSPSRPSIALPDPGPAPSVIIPGPSPPSRSNFSHEPQESDEEKQAQVRKRSLIERMARLGGIKLGAAIGPGHPSRKQPSTPTPAPVLAPAPTPESVEPSSPIPYAVKESVIKDFVDSTEGEKRLTAGTSELSHPTASKTVLPPVPVADPTYTRVEEDEDWYTEEDEVPPVVPSKPYSQSLSPPPPPPPPPKEQTYYHGEETQLDYGHASQSDVSHNNTPYVEHFTHYTQPQQSYYSPYGQVPVSQMTEHVAYTNSQPQTAPPGRVYDVYSPGDHSTSTMHPSQERFDPRGPALPHITYEVAQSDTWESKPYASMTDHPQYSQPSSEELFAIWRRVGCHVDGAAAALLEKSKAEIIDDGTPTGFVEAALDLVSSAEPISKETYGHLIYAQNGRTVNMMITEILPGDIVAMTDVHFHGTKSNFKRYELTIETQGGPFLCIVQDMDPKRRKLRVYQTTAPNPDAPGPVCSRDRWDVDCSDFCCKKGR